MDVGDTKRCGYYELPLVPTSSNTRLPKMKMKFLRCIYKHLHSNAATVPRRLNPRDKSYKYVAFHHFSPRILKENNQGPIDIVDNRTAHLLCFTESDRLPSECCSETGYFPAPSCTTEPMLQDLQVAERSAATASTHSSSIELINDGVACEDSMICASRRTSEERERDRIWRMVEQNPEDAVSELVASRKQVDALVTSNYELSKENKNLEEEVALLNEELKNVFGCWPHFVSHSNDRIV